PRPDQHRGRLAHPTTHDVEAPVHAEDEVHVRVPGRAVHDGVARRASAEGVRRGVLGPLVRLQLGQAQPYRAGPQLPAEQRAPDRRDLGRRRGGPGERGRHDDSAGSDSTATERSGTTRCTVASTRAIMMLAAPAMPTALPAYAMKSRLYGSTSGGAAT